MSHRIASADAAARRPGAGPPRARRSALAILAAAVVLAAGCGTSSHEERVFPVEIPVGGEPPVAIPVDKMVFAVTPPPWSDPDIFPCTQCHDKTLPANPTRRVFSTTHAEITLHHDEEHRWCLDCHDAENRDMLRLVNGSLVPFTASYRLCGQCHGDKYREWRAGVHGRRTGRWDGEKQYLLCVTCHYSHAPKFKPIAPKPPPVTPGSIR